MINVELIGFGEEADYKPEEIDKIIQDIILVIGQNIDLIEKVAITNIKSVCINAFTLKRGKETAFIRMYYTDDHSLTRVEEFGKLLHFKVGLDVEIIHLEVLISYFSK